MESPEPSDRARDSLGREGRQRREASRPSCIYPQSRAPSAPIARHGGNPAPRRSWNEATSDDLAVGPTALRAVAERKRSHGGQSERGIREIEATIIGVGGRIGRVRALPRDLGSAGPDRRSHDPGIDGYPGSRDRGGELAVAGLAGDARTVDGSRPLPDDPGFTASWCTRIPPTAKSLAEQARISPKDYPIADRLKVGHASWVVKLVGGAAGHPAGISSRLA
jgi:hypothetical protein